MWVEEGGSILKICILISVTYDMKKQKQKKHWFGAYSQLHVWLEISM